MRELVMKYKAEKVCHEEMVKMPLVDLKVLETQYKERHRLLRPVSFGAYRDERVLRIIARAARIYMDYRKLSLHVVKGGARVAFKDEFGAAEEREVLYEAQQGRSGVKMKLFGSFRNNMGLPPEVYALVSNHKVAKELWERIQLLMQGTSLTKQERECKLYDKFDKFAYKKGETLLNTKFLNTLPPEWSKFVTDVKLVRDLHTTNIDQLHAYLGQHEFHANEGRQTSLATGTSRTYTSGANRNNSGKQRTVIYYNYKMEGHMSKQCTKPKKKWDDSWFKDKVLLNSNSPIQQDALILSVIEQLKTQVVKCTKINLDNKSVNDTLTAELKRYKEHVRILTEGQNVDLKSKDNISDSCAQSVEIDNLKQTLLEHLKEKESLMQTVTLFKNDFQKEESRNIDREIALEKHIKELNNIVFERNQSTQTVHILMKPQFFYDHTTKQALEPTPSSIPTKVEVPKELSKVSMSQEKDMVIKKLKDIIKSLSGNTKEDTIKKELEEIETINIELDHRVTKLIAKNEHLKQAYKQLYDSIKSSMCYV
nr:integrase, catalytic region, zinc finger, CCHC-type, peptidase aspartic, catalytic [Tanacetum cinerariifolium]